jgi:hypothetical protein
MAASFNALKTGVARKANAVLVTIGARAAPKPAQPNRLHIAMRLSMAVASAVLGLCMAVVSVTNFRLPRTFNSIRLVSSPAATPDATPDLVVHTSWANVR